MQNYRRRLGWEVRQPRKQRQVASRIFPAAKRQSTDGSGQSPGHDGTAPTKLRLGLLAAKGPADSNDQADRHAQTNEVSNEFRKPRPGIVQHCIGRGGTEQEDINDTRYYKPK